MVDVLVTLDYDKSKIIINNNDNEHNFETSNSNFIKIFRYLLKNTKDLIFESQLSTWPPC